MSQYTGKMTTLGFNGNEVEHAAVTRAAQKLRQENAAWCRAVLMKAAAEELGVSVAVLDRDSPTAFGRGYVPLTEAEKALLARKRPPRGDLRVVSAPSRAKQGTAERTRATRAEADRIRAAKLAAAAAKLEAALAEYDALGEPAALKPRRRR